MRAYLPLLLFIIVSLASGWLGVWLDVWLDQPEGNTAGMGLWLVLPFLTMLLLRLFHRDWKDAGFSFRFKGNLKWYALALTVYPIVTALLVGVALSFKSVRLSLPEESVAMLVLTSVAGSFVKNIFEEFAWRGYLAPKLVERRLPDPVVYIVSGLVWGLWHAPYYLYFLPDVYFTTMSRPTFLLVGCLLMTAWSVMFVEIYRLTNSVWPCVLMHAIEDGVPTLLVTISGIVTFTTAGKLWLDPTTGIVATTLYLAFGLWLRQKRMQNEEERSR